MVSQEGLRVLLLARLSPVLPFNLLNVAYGLSEIPPLTFGLGLIGIVPGTVLYVGLGSAVAGTVAFVLAIFFTLRPWRGKAARRLNTGDHDGIS